MILCRNSLLFIFTRDAGGHLVALGPSRNKAAAVCCGNCNDGFGVKTRIWHWVWFGVILDVPQRAVIAQTGWISQPEVNGEKAGDVGVVTLINLSFLELLLQIEVKC